MFDRETILLSLSLSTKVKKTEVEVQTGAFNTDNSKH